MSKERLQAFRERQSALKVARGKLFDEGEPSSEKVCQHRSVTFYLFYFIDLLFCFFSLFIIQVLDHLLKFISNLGIKITPPNLVELEQCVKTKTPKVLTYDNVDAYVTYYFINSKLTINLSVLYFNAFFAGIFPSERKMNNKGNEHHSTVSKAMGSSPSSGAFGSTEWCKETMAHLHTPLLTDKMVSYKKSRR